MELQAKELRIGNYIQGEIEEDKFIDIEVVAIDSVDITECSLWGAGLKEQADHYYSFKPIPLTEEWLVKLGVNFGFNVYASEYMIEHAIDSYCLRLVYGVGMSKFISELKYVHQLQNLYFALTNEELEIKEL